MSEAASRDLAKVAFMRAHGLTSAKWSTVQMYDPGGGLVHVETITECTLGPAPQAAEDDTDTKPDTQPSLTPQQREQRMRDERRRIASASSGGPVRRLDERD